MYIFHLVEIEQETFISICFVGSIFRDYCYDRTIFLETYKEKIKIPAVLSGMWTMFLWMMSMVLFRAETLTASIQYYKSLFGKLGLQNVGYSLSWYLGKHEIFILFICVVASFPLGKNIYMWMQKRLSDTTFVILINIGTFILLGISILYVVTSTYNPFIYFQF